MRFDCDLLFFEHKRQFPVRRTYLGLTDTKLDVAVETEYLCGNFKPTKYEEVKCTCLI